MVSGLTATTLTLTPITSNAGQKTIVCYKHAGNRNVDGWTGRWTGVNDSFMYIVPDSLDYKIVMVDHNRVRDFRGTAENDRIKFTRNGVVEFITSGAGKETGVQQAEKKKHCLLIKSGEAYWRD